MSKIVGTFTNHRSVSPLQSASKRQPLPSLQYSVLRQREDLDRLTDTIGSFLTNVPSFVQANYQT
jgi:hypothetical protein